jgi:hypothetical protein
LTGRNRRFFHAFASGPYPDSSIGLVVNAWMSFLR